MKWLDSTPKQTFKYWFGLLAWILWSADPRNVCYSWQWSLKQEMETDDFSGAPYLCHNNLPFLIGTEAQQGLSKGNKFPGTKYIMILWKKPNGLTIKYFHPNNNQLHWASGQLRTQHLAHTPSCCLCPQISQPELLPNFASYYGWPWSWILGDV